MLSEQPPSLEPIVISPAPAEFFSAASAMGVEFEETDVPRLEQFLKLMLEANRKVNLTAITDPGEAWRKHILDALSLVGVIASAGVAAAHASEAAGEKAGAMKVIDIGSGGGVPAIPLAIVMPDVRFTLVDSTGKKVEYLQGTSNELDLKNVRVLNARAEMLGQDRRTHREKYDVATARALGHLAVVIELCGPLVRPGGIVIAVKGAKAEQELEEAKDALGKVGLRHVQTIETTTGRLVILEKTTRTPRLYPRRDGEPSRVPLGVKRERPKKAGKPDGGARPAKDDVSKSSRDKAD